MPQRDQLRLVFEAIDEDPRVRVIVLRAVGEHFSSGGNIKGFLEASPEHVSKLAWNIAAPARCAKPVIAANRGYCFGVGFEISLACDFRLVSETCFYALPEQRHIQLLRPRLSGATSYSVLAPWLCPGFVQATFFARQRSSPSRSP